MPKLRTAWAFATPVRQVVTCAVLLLAGALIGGLSTWHSRDPHAATAERLTGTVRWSNQQTRLIAFEPDGVPHNPGDSQVFYQVVADELNFPGCLIGHGEDPVREDPRRVELDAIHQEAGGRQQAHFAASVRCLE